jgi:hypothetical protein
MRVYRGLMSKKGQNTEEIAKKMAEYAKRIFTDYEFAKSEFANAGVELDQRVHQEMISGYKSLENSANKVFRQGAQEPMRGVGGVVYF